MSDGNASDAWNTALIRDFGEEVVEGSDFPCLVVGNLGEPSEGDAGDAVERARGAELREHAIEAIDRFVDVLEDENRAVEPRSEGRSAERGEHGKVTAGEPAGRDSAAKRRCFGGRHGRDAAGHGRDERRSCIVGEMRARRRAVKGDELGAGADCRVERGDVRVADERARAVAPRGVVEAIEEPRCAVSTADAPDRVDRGVFGESVEVGAARVVDAGKVAGALEHVVADDRLPAHRTSVL